MMRLRTLGLLIPLLVTACSRRPPAAEQRTIVDVLTRRVKDAYDLSKPNVEQRLMSLYPDSGRVVSASGGRVLTSRDSLGMGIKAFWENVGFNMRNPSWVWDQMLFDVLARDAAVMTATYHITHRNPRGMPHVIGGAWTVSV